MSERLAQLQEFLLENPQDPFLHYAMATELNKLGRKEEALHAYRDLVLRFPNYVGTYYHLGKLFESLGKIEDAIQTYEEGMIVARSEGNHHALGELQSAWALLKQADAWDEDDDWD